MTPGKPISRRDFVSGAGRIALATAGAGLFPCSALLAPASAAGLKQGFVTRRKASYFTRLDRLRVRCDLCPFDCEIDNGVRGRCGVRENVDGTLWTVAFGNP